MPDTLILAFITGSLASAALLLWFRKRRMALATVAFLSGTAYFFIVGRLIVTETVPSVPSGPVCDVLDDDCGAADDDPAAGTDAETEIMYVIDASGSMGPILQDLFSNAKEGDECPVPCSP